MKKIIVSFLISILLLFLIVVTAALPKATKITYSYQIDTVNKKWDNVDSKKWLSRIDDNKYISDIMLPGSHDSCSNIIPLPYKTRCQDHNLKEQLEMGVRYLDIKIYESNEILYISHGPVIAKKNKPSFFADNMQLVDVLHEISDFLKQNPSEFVLMTIKIERREGEHNKIFNLIKNQITSVFNAKRLYTNPTIPTLKDARGKMIFARRYNAINEKEDKNLFGIPFYWSQQENKILDLKLLNKNSNTPFSVYVQNQFKLKAHDKYIAFNEMAKNHFLNDKSFKLNFMSRSETKLMDSPNTNAKNSNKYIHDILAKYKYNKQIVVVDFIHSDMAKCIFSCN